MIVLARSAGRASLTLVAGLWTWGPTGPLPAEAARPALRPAAQSLAEARGAARAGDYDEAAALFRRLVRAEPEAAAARRGLARVLIQTGEYSAAEAVAREAPDPVSLANLLGEALLLQGKLDAAEAGFRVAAGELPPSALGGEGGPNTRAVARRADDHLAARVNLADLLRSRGQLAEAEARFDAFIDIYNARAPSLSAGELVAVGRAVRGLARSNPGLFQDALRAFDEAAAADPGWSEPLSRAGALFLEKYQSPEAQAEFEKVLGANPNEPRALLGLARAALFDGGTDPGPPLARLLEVNPNHWEGRALAAQLLLRRERHSEAASEAERILELNPASLDALTVLAASRYLAGDSAGFASVRNDALAISPHYAALDLELAKLLERQRRYAEAAERAGAAVAVDAKAWEAHGLLGLNQLRMGRIADGRASLDRAFAGDPYNPWFKNSLDLLDTFDRFRSLADHRFEFFLHETEAELLHAYLAPVAHEAYDSLVLRYGVEPSSPVRAELYPSHADFSVRTLGEAGLGALGVSFGPVIAMDSPGARELGDYNWASVFWHELAHTFHLHASKGRVPRWFSEGLAVHEQRRGRPGWGHQASLSFVDALVGGNLKKVSELDDGFMRPDFPGQVALSYYQASLVFQYLEGERGFGPIRKMLEGYGDGLSTHELVERHLGMTLDDLDDEFDRYLRRRFSQAANGRRGAVGGAPGASPEELERLVGRFPGDPSARLRLGAALARDGRHGEARPHLEAALAAFPELGGPSSPHRLLAEGYEAEGNVEAAAHHLFELRLLWEAGYESLVRLADLLILLERADESATVLDEAVLIWPYDIDLHRRLAETHGLLGNHEAAVREREAVVALDPPDRAQAFYLLSIARRDAGDREGARRDVLRALDIAPTFEEALELLLELRGAGR